ncbi:MAG: formate hydrogenlyase [Rhodospirillales bacterium]|nr:formate hydrogenlyase [Rhodospirillales bacterium]
MILGLAAILTQLMHLALVLALAPVLVGLVRLVKARLMGRRGPALLQPWRDLAKLLRKRPVLAEGATEISRAGPYVACAATLFAAVLVPGFAQGMLLAPLADLLLLAGLLALARVALALAGMDVGTAFGGMGAARELSFSAFAEPVLLLCILVLAMIGGTTNLDAMILAFREGGVGLRVSLALIAVALLAVGLVENARMPADNPATHLELTMVHEAMILEASGRHLAVWELQAALKLLVWMGLLSAIFIPWGIAPAGAGPLAWLLGLVVWLGKITALAVALAVFESAIAKMRVFRIPEFLGVALLLAALAVALLFVSTGLA